MCRLIKISSIYETAPCGYREQSDFFNGALKIETDFGIFELLSFLKGIERELGRTAGPKNGPREIDLDILFFNDMIYSDEKITVPHKEVLNRDFVLTPLCEIEPGLTHPALNKKICEIELSGEEEYILKKFSEDLIKIEEFTC
jgi:2-amino-4-hydroxy-6-hydroxymethyldihydropteridine diphosphokinase